jgi:phytoene synthase
MRAAPDAPATRTREEARAHARDLDACRDLLREGSKSFYAASMLLPARLRPDVYALYAFCRVADDEVDEGADPFAAARSLRARLELAYAGAPRATPVDRAFAAMVARRDIPIALPLALIEGFEWDAVRRRCETLSDTCAYGVRVAGSVGVMMTLLMGVRGAQALARASDLGVAMQLTNIARDVGEDARAGRLYLPRAWFAEEGLDPDAWLADPRPCPQVARMTARLLRAAQRLYWRAEGGVARLPADVRPAIWAARSIYADIGRRIARNGYDSVSARAIVSKPRKLALLAAAYGSAALARPGFSEPPLPEAAYLVEAAAPFDPPRAPGRDSRVSRVIDLFHRLEEAERRRAGAGEAETA